MLIGDVAHQFSITADTLRYYDRIGLVVPQRSSGLRRYSAADLQKLGTVLKMKTLRFSLAEIQTLLSADAAVDCSRGQARPNQEAAETLLLLVSQKLAEMAILQKELSAVESVLQGYANKIKQVLGETD